MRYCLITVFFEEFSSNYNRFNIDILNIDERGKKMKKKFQNGTSIFLTLILFFFLAATGVMAEDVVGGGTKRHTRK